MMIESSGFPVKLVKVSKSEQKRICVFLFSSSSISLQICCFLFRELIHYLIAMDSDCASVASTQPDEDSVSSFLFSCLIPLFRPSRASFGLCHHLQCNHSIQKIKKKTRKRKISKEIKSMDIGVFFRSKIEGQPKEENQPKTGRQQDEEKVGRSFTVTVLFTGFEPSYRAG